MGTARGGFTRKKVKSLTLGEKLQKLRTRRRVLLSEVAKHTKIQVKYLEALEESQYDQLPADVYVRGFLRSYAQYFNMSSTPLIKLYERERGIHETISHGQQEDVSTEGDGKSFVQPKRFIITPKIIIAVIGGLLFLGIATFLYTELDRFVSSPWLVIDEPIDGSTATVQTITVRGTSEPQARVFINEQAVLVDRDGVFVEEVGINSGANTITVRSVNSFDKESVQTRIVHGPEEEVVAQEEPQEEAYDGVHVEIRTGDTRVWLSVSVDGEEVYSKTTEPGVIEVFDGEESVSVTAGIGNQVFVSINGRDEEILSDSAGLVSDQEFVREEDSVEDDNSDGENTVEQEG